jgi:hypothetical protein
LTIKTHRSHSIVLCIQIDLKRILIEYLSKKSRPPLFQIKKYLNTFLKYKKIVNYIRLPLISWNDKTGKNQNYIKIATGAIDYLY